MSRLAPFPLTSLEVASGIVLGPGTSPPPQPPTDSGATPIAAFERAVREALERPPCLVSFSGGRDSSAVLAVAARVARREGLPLPIPATYRFPAVDLADEVDWQELVVAHLGLDDWFRTEVGAELDCVGPVATDVLRRHGLLWPFNAFFHVPLLEAARGGSLITGVGGDEVFGASRWARAAAVLTGKARPRPRDAMRIASRARAPAAAGADPAAQDRHRLPVAPTRVAPAASWTPGPGRTPPSPSAGARTSAGGARSVTGRWVNGASPCSQQTPTPEIVHPFADPGFFQALARLPKERRFSDRTAAMEMLFGDTLPEALIERASKASFDGAFFNVHSRRLAETWDGEGADPTHVDPEALRTVWSGPEPDGRSFLLLQSASLAREHADLVAMTPSIG